MPSRSVFVMLAACLLALAASVLQSRDAIPAIFNWQGATQQQVSADAHDERYLLTSCARPTASGRLAAVNPPAGRVAPVASAGALRFYDGQFFRNGGLSAGSSSRSPGNGAVDTWWPAAPRYLSCSPDFDAVGWQ